MEVIHSLRADSDDKQVQIGDLKAQLLRERVKNANPPASRADARAANVLGSGAGGGGGGGNARESDGRSAGAKAEAYAETVELKTRIYMLEQENADLRKNVGLLTTKVRLDACFGVLRWHPDDALMWCFWAQIISISFRFL